MLAKYLYRNLLFFYRLSRRIRYRFTDTGILIAGVLSTAAIFGLDTRQTFSYQLFSFFFVLFLICFVFLFPVRPRFKIYRILPQSCTQDSPVSYDLVIEKLDDKGSGQIAVLDEIHSPLPTYDEFRIYKNEEKYDVNFIDRLIGYPLLVKLIARKRGAEIVELKTESPGGRESVKKKISFVPIRRGYLYFERTVVSHTDPLGLLRNPVSIPVRDTLLVFPKQYNIPDITLSGKRKYHRGGINLATNVGESGEFLSLRDYRVGDPLKKLHWKSFAKTGKPTTKEYQEEYFSRTGLVLDTFAAGLPKRNFEEAVSIACSIISAKTSHESLLDLMFIKDKAYRATTGRSLGDKLSLMEILACVEPESEENIETLENLVLSNSAESNSFICILLSWNRRRQAFINTLRARELSLLTILITTDDDMQTSYFADMTDSESSFWLLQAGKIEESLDHYGAVI